MTCPVGWFSAATEVLWEEYGYLVKRIVFLFLALVNLILWKLI